MNDNPLFSIIVPIYNVEKYLRQCVDSILNQSFTDFEILLIDDGSFDNSGAICDEYVTRYPNKISVIHKSNGGLSDARNTGIRTAKGEYLIFADSDDFYCEKNFFMHIAQKLQKEKVDVIFCRYKKVFENGESQTIKPYENSKINGLRDDELINYLSLNDQLDSSACSKVLNRKFLLKHSLYFEVGLFSEDVEWISRCIPYIATADFIYDVSYCYRMREGSITHAIGNKNIKDMIYSVKTYAKKDLQFKLSSLKTEAYYNFIAYQFFIVIGLIGRYLKGKERKIMIKELNEYKWLCKYAKSPKNKKACIVVRLFGIGFSSFILGEYIRRK